ncbi:type IV toxin-antitoxin system AbiEi family antitoxin domain-containing protein [Serinibacter salmoneus]|uniref:AbiEi antitoxin N-terminal domain-containing protein n=1 Tax=Serinibacter salmoneus TaxID=556530 RepID=A0A2A9D3Q5_9MICO|nr:type IV toxin-antitoxin system AbiEi family antitoxin domain-containing protein [Serinibacter salmoneus]PFG20592.1 hypothetical protein ATL40_2198 [Serinibacter salmoneus]
MATTIRTGEQQVPILADRALTETARAMAARQCGIVSTRQLDAAGVGRSTRTTRVRAGRWVRLCRGVYDLAACAPADLTHEQRTRRAAFVALVTYGDRAIAVGLTALTIHGVWGVPMREPPQITTSDIGGRAGRGSARCRRFEPGEVWTVDGLRVVEPCLALAQALPEVAPRTALGLLDSALHRGVITEADLVRVRALMRGRRWCRRVAVIWDLVDGRRESPLESWAYFDLTAEGLEPTGIQVPVRDEQGVARARADIALVFRDGSHRFLELDGREWHDQPGVDDARDNTIAVLDGTPVLRYGSAALGREGRMVHDVRTLAIAHGGIVPPDRRLHSVDPEAFVSPRPFSTRSSSRAPSAGVQG